MLFVRNIIGKCVSIVLHCTVLGIVCYCGAGLLYIVSYQEIGLTVAL